MRYEDVDGTNSGMAWTAEERRRHALAVERGREDDIRRERQRKAREAERSRPKSQAEVDLMLCDRVDKMTSELRSYREVFGEASPLLRASLSLMKRQTALLFTEEA